MSSITIYHNPNCGTSRNTLAMIRQSGVEPNIIEYLKTPPNRAELKALLKGMGLGVRDVWDAARLAIGGSGCAGHR